MKHHLSKKDSYTTMAAEILFQEGRSMPLLRLVVQPPLQFLKAYFLRRGLLDGRAGFILAILHARYEFLRMRKLVALKAQAKRA
jgi:hypothetical protein